MKNTNLGSRWGGKWTVTKAVVLLVPDESADEIGRLIAATLSMNGYGHNDPAVLDLWEDPKTGGRGLSHDGY